MERRPGLCFLKGLGYFMAMMTTAITMTLGAASPVLSAAEVATQFSSSMGAQECIELDYAQDCKRDNQFVCARAFSDKPYPYFGFCLTNASSVSGWSCCRLPVKSSTPLPPAPARSANYPLPSSKRPSPTAAKPNIVFVLTDVSFFVFNRCSTYSPPRCCCSCGR